MNIMAGYTVFSVKYIDRAIPRSTQRRIRRTTKSDMIRYVRLLSRQLNNDVQGLCEFDLNDGVIAMMQAVKKMRECTKLENMSCNRYAFVAVC